MAVGGERAAAGDRFTTGDRVPEAAVYRFRSHTDDAECAHDRAVQVAMVPGDVFPAHPECRRPCEWELVQHAPSAAPVKDVS
jgi:hypothetical protein